MVDYYETHETDFVGFLEELLISSFRPPTSCSFADVDELHAMFNPFE